MTILITGANRGIGFLLVKKLVESSSIPNQIILLGCRDLKRGEEALQKLNSPSNVHLLQLDISSSTSILHAVEEIKEKYNGQIDILINNAAIFTTELDFSRARELFDTNYYGIRLLNENLVDLMSKNGRIINVASRVGLNVLRDCSVELQQKYLSSELTKNQLDQLVQDFLNSSFENLGYSPKSECLIYGVSKLALICLTQIEARQWPHLTIVSVTPGFCATDMTQYDPNARSPELGADSILYVVNTPKDQLVNGAFYRDGIQLPLIDAVSFS